MSALAKRVEAVQTVLARFEKQPLAWGRFDCGRLAVAMLRAMGHKVRLSQFGQFSTEAGALAAIQRKGFNDLPEILDSWGLPRIAPAAALPGDLIGFLPQVNPQTGAPASPFTSLAVFIGNGRILGFHDAVGLCVVMQPDFLSAERPPIAWRL